ncbi:hypothetical protein BESB_033690 [Besnoitia besnoiti]|uniref:Uncharacterized protein n=1 Tax=Besnoitia besnoiti TaxID=94643 RepID=A0A2A9MKT9_BESBE|nr:hypothetical protein BESB_033690 [Besnoitia besnoiti]PFH36911.1 hypothetical protein BESB_033690 [Besnoitia besnoiti]
MRGRTEETTRKESGAFRKLKKKPQKGTGGERGAIEVEERPNRLPHQQRISKLGAFFASGKPIFFFILSSGALASSGSEPRAKPSGSKEQQPARHGVHALAAVSVPSCFLANEFRFSSERLSRQAGPSNATGVVCLSRLHTPERLEAAFAASLSRVVFVVAVLPPLGRQSVAFRCRGEVCGRARGMPSESPVGVSSASPTPRLRVFSSFLGLARLAAVSPPGGPESVLCGGAGHGSTGTQWTLRVSVTSPRRAERALAACLALTPGRCDAAAAGPSFGPRDAMRIFFRGTHRIRTAHAQPPSAESRAEAARRPRTGKNPRYSQARREPGAHLHSSCVPSCNLHISAKRPPVFVNAFAPRESTAESLCSPSSRATPKDREGAA